MKFTQKAFTLIEVLISIVIVAMVLVSGFQAYYMILAGKVKLIERTKLEKESVFFSERLFQTIKEGGIIDYEEYFNRMLVGTGTSNGHYSIESGFGNYGNGGNVGTFTYGDGFYYCRSLCVNSPCAVDDIGFMTKTGGCYNNNLNTDISGTKSPVDQTGQPQRYGQYSGAGENFLGQSGDYNKDGRDDSKEGGNPGDYFSIGSIIDEKDDLALWGLPSVFNYNENVVELYLISGSGKNRTFFRYNVKDDPDAIPGATCDFSDGVGTGSGCLGNIEFLELDGKDYGMKHGSEADDSWYNDGIIDTWLVDKKFGGNGTEIAGSSSTETYWKPLFPDSINVSKFQVFLYPDKNQKIDDTEKKISPYVSLVIEVKPSWEIKKKVKGDINPIKLNTTINLTEVFSK